MSKQDFFEHLDACAVDWSYFTNFEVLDKLDLYHSELTALDSLSLSDEETIELELLRIVRQFPKSIHLLLLMIAVRENKLSQLKIESSYGLSFKHQTLLSDKVNEDELLAFFRESGLKKLFLSKRIVHLGSYLMGAEVGLDSNTRKNRSGKLMASKCELILNQYCEENNYKGARERTLENYGINLDKQFDYLIEHPEGIIVFEFNLYNSNGSKIKSISKEYQKLQLTLNKLNVTFVWVTSGEAWLSNKGLANDNLNTITHFINYHQLKSGYMTNYF